MEYHFKVHRESGGFWAECMELEGCITQADSVEELKENMQEALNLYMEEPEESKDIFPLPDNSIRRSKTVVKVALDPQIAFAYMVRFYRLKHGLSQKKAAKELGFENVYSYQRLETRRCNPNLKTIYKIKQLFPELSIDQLFAA